MEEAPGRPDNDEGRIPEGIDTSVAHQARVYDYWLGGKDNFAVDREAAELALAAYPGLRRGVRLQRAFLAFHPASDILPEQSHEAARRVSARSATTTKLRRREEVLSFFDGLELLEPGVVQVHQWQPGSAAPDDGEQVAGWVGLARKP